MTTQIVSAHQVVINYVRKLFSIVGALPNLLVVKLKLVCFSGLEVREKSGASLWWVICENLLSFALILSE